jgi:tetratricopeptide (TPR) repeat protein
MKALREQPGNSAPLRTVFYELTYRGYLREAHRIALQFVEQDPLSSVANYSLAESFVALGKTSEAFAPLQLSLELDNAFAAWFVPIFYLAAGRDEIAIAYYEADLDRAGMSDTTWVRELVAAARDPVAGEAYLDSRIPQIVAFIPEEYAPDWQYNFDTWYLAFGFLDHYFEEILAVGPDDKIWTGANIQVWLGTIFRRVGFTSHPKYLEVAELLGMTGVWEQRRPPDFCDKVDGKWVCE